MHTIHDIAFEVTVHNDHQRISWEQYYADFLKNKLLPRVESLCDDWSRKHPNTKCTIDTIDINVEVDSLNLEELQKEIIQQINRQLISIPSDGSSGEGKLKAVFTRESSMLDGLLSYLSSGILLANVPIKNFKEWLGNCSEFNSTEKAKLNTLFATSTDAIERMLSLLRNDYTAFAVLMETKQHITTQFIQLEASFFKKFLQAICTSFQLEYTDENANIWYKTLGTSSSLAQFSKTFLQLLQPKVTSEGKRLTNENPRYVSIALLQAIVQYEKRKEVTISVSKIGKVVKDTKATKEKDTKDSVAAKKASKKATLDAETATSQTEIQNDQTSSNTENSTEAMQLPVDEKGLENSETEIQQTSESANIQGKTTEVLENTTTKRSESHLAKTDKKNGITGEIALTTEKSGLILLHPFLTTFFKGVGLVTDTNEIKDVEKACLLLHYLATESEEVTDVELTLEKILLGVSLETIVDCQISLTDEDKALCDELLQAVLTHWVVLKKSTVNTLRDMFLKRDGHIIITEDSIKLKIEHLAQDILLDKVPWNIRLFRLKWMEKIVHVEW